MKKPTLCLIFGGKSSEYLVSLASFYNVYNSLSKEKYDVLNIGITKEGRWLLYKGDIECVLNDTWQNGECYDVMLDINNGLFLTNGESIKPDIVFPIMHGEFGEDGRIISLFEVAGIKYAGCDFFTSMLSMDKNLCKLVAKQNGIKVAKWIFVNKKEGVNKTLLKEFINEVKLPVFIKPSRGGSSVGVYKAYTESEVYTYLLKSFELSNGVIIEEAIDGIETEVAVCEVNGTPLFSSPGQILYKSDFYDYKTKYEESEVKYLIPAKISEKTKKSLDTYLKKLYFALGIKGLCRMDFFILDDGEVVFNEVNTLPGFTEHSMYLKLFEAQGYQAEEILNYILNI